MEILNQIPHLNPADFVFIGLSVLFTGISWYYFIAVFSRIRITQSPTERSPLPPVSVIIAAKNELHNLKENLPIILNQEYPDYEVIIVDDGSFDGTGPWIQQLMQTEPRLKYSFLDPEHMRIRGKKIALTLAFKKAFYAYFVLTDADCKPASNQWLKRMAAGLKGDKDIVLGYSPYSRKKGLLNTFVRLETIQTALSYLGFASTGKAYMGVGRNLAYSREVYLSVNGFASHHHVPCGDDDLFVQDAATATNTVICVHPEAYTYTGSKNTWAEYYRQKLRHLWAGKFYTQPVKNRLFWYTFSQVIFVPILITWLLLGSWWVWPVAALVLKLIPEWIVFGKKAKLLRGKDLILFYPFIRFSLGIWMLVLGTSAFFSKKPKW